MNRLKGIVSGVKKVDSFAFVEVKIDKHIFGALAVFDESLAWLEVGREVEVLFKETEVMLANIGSKVSARNAFVSPIKEIENGELLSRVVFDFCSQDISAVITKGSLESLGCKVNEEFLWFIKANEVSIQTVGNFTH